MKTIIHFLIICGSFLLRMRNVSNYSCIANQNTYFMSKNSFSKIVQFMIQCGKNIVKPEGPQMKIRRMRIACWVPKTTSTHLLLSRFINGCTKTPKCYIILHCLPLFLFIN